MAKADTHQSPAPTHTAQLQARQNLAAAQKMPPPVTKAALYNAVHTLRGQLNISYQKYPLNALSLAQALALRVEQAPFQTPGLRGAAVPAQRLIILDAKLSPAHKNFYCAHEICHHLWHANGPGAIRCYDVPDPASPVPAAQNAYIEWQANEGAAELLVPLRVLLPTLKKYKGTYEEDRALRQFMAYLAAEFHVPRATIQLRLDSLKYEIQQYLAGIPLHQLAVLSHSAQQSRGIRVQSLPARYLKRL